MRNLSVYIKRLTATQCAKQIDISKDAVHFFGVNPNTYSNINLRMKYAGSNNISIIQIQPATNLRFSNNILHLNPNVTAVEGDYLCITKDSTDNVYVVTIAKGSLSALQLLSDITLTSKETISNIIIDDDHDIDDDWEDEDEWEEDEDFDEKNDNPYRQYITAIKSKPFLILAGISGTGKSRIVRELARACWDKDGDEYKAQKPKNFEMIQVKPNWHDSSELIGYVSRIDGVHYVVGPFLKFMTKAILDPKTPYFLCLDEMNLAPVEQYFAEYLSVIESRKADGKGNVTTDPLVDYSDSQDYVSLIHQLFPDDEELRREYLKKEGGKRLTIPQNLIVVGTVNMDETTFSFSRKVLDRAMTIEMNDVDLEAGLEMKYEKIDKLSKDDLIGTAVEGVDIYSDNEECCDDAISYLQSINSKLDGTPFKIAYRTRNEVLLYVVNNLPYNVAEDGDELNRDYVVARALDEITNMKILSRIEGDESKVSKAFLEDLSSTIKSGLEEIYNGPFGTEETRETFKSVSLAKLAEMKKRLESGYTSFWN